MNASTTAPGEMEQRRLTHWSNERQAYQNRIEHMNAKAKHALVASVPAE